MMIEKLEFVIGGFFSGFKMAKIRTEEENLVISYQGDNRSPDLVYSRILSAEEANRLTIGLQGLKINSWKKTYEDPDVLDGTSWGLEYKEEGKRCRHISGSNDFPPCWNDFIRCLGTVFPELLAETLEDLSGDSVMRILFIGNSHTYFNDLPELVARRFREIGIDCEVTMIAHGGWFLEQHTKEPDVLFNIKYGHYDYVVLQEHSHPFGPIEKFEKAASTLSDWIKEAGSMPVIYMTWAKKDEESEQDRMIKAHREVAEKNGALLAPVGEHWWEYKRSHPEVEMYASDGAHASPAGSDFAAKLIYETIYNDSK